MSRIRRLSTSWRGSLRLGGQVWATLGLGYVNATLTTTGEPLPRIPPLRGTLSLDIPVGRLTISPELVGRPLRPEWTHPKGQK